MTLSQALERQDMPYGAVLRLTVVARGDCQNYVNQKGEDMSCLNVAMADSSKTALVKIYKTALQPKFKVGATLALRNIVVRNNMIIVTNTSLAFPTQCQTVPQERYQEGALLVNPPPAPVVTLSAALKTPPKTCVSVEGLVVQEDANRQVQVKGSPVTIKDIYLKDQTEAKVKITFWRPDEPFPTSVGDYVRVTDLYTNTFKKETSLTSTSNSRITKHDPPEQSEHITIVGACQIDDDLIELLLEDDSIRAIPTYILATVLDFEGTVEVYFVQHAPVTMTMVSQRDAVTSISLT